MRKLLIILLLPFLLSWQVKPPLGRQINFSQPLSKGLVGCWLMNEGSGSTVNDLSGNGNHVDWVGTPIYVPGKFGPACDFPSTGNSEYLTKAPSVGWGDGSEGTIVIYFKIDSAVNYGSPFCTKVGVDDVINIWLYSTPYIRIDHFNTEGSDWADFSWAGITTDTWYHFVYRWANDLAEIYINGALAASESSFSGTPRISSTIYIGSNRGDASRGLDGQIDHLLAFNRAVTTSEIIQLYREPFCILYPSFSYLLYGGIAVPSGGQVIIVNVN
ncbi:MAG: LamG domain-containing protein [Phycisphaerales bacterium]|jgi:hypothetical protein